MKLIVKKYPTAVLLFGAGLVSCASGDDKYRSTEMLERPPTLIVDKKNASQPVEENLQTETESGLGDKVTLSESDPLRLTIKQPFVQAWNTVELALTQQELAITDRNRDKGQFYIVYKPGGFFSKLLDFSSALHNDANYILTLEGKDDETAVSVTLIEPDNSQASPDGYYDAPEDKSKTLLQTLYDTLRNDLKTD